MPHSLIPPHGGTLVNPIVDAARAEELKRDSRDWPSIDLTPRQLCDLELLLNGGFSPLTGFLGKADYERVITEMRLADGTLWPIPVMLDIDDEMAGRLGRGAVLALARRRGRDARRPPRRGPVAGRPGARGGGRLRHRQPRAPGGEPPARGDQALVRRAGASRGSPLPHHYDFRTLRLTPAEVRERFARRGWRRVVAFQTRNPMHRAHLELTVRAARRSRPTCSSTRSWA